jgi:esterase
LSPVRDLFQALSIVYFIVTKRRGKFPALNMQLYFKSEGQGPALILLHGLFGSSDNWHHITVRLAETFRVLVPDLRNHGQSPHSAVMDYPLMAGDVAEMMEAQGLPAAPVIGHSMGGKVAMQLALQSPERVEKLIVSDMTPRTYAPAHDRIFNALLALDLPAYASRPQLEEVLAPDIPSLMLRRFLLKNLGRDAHGKFFWKMNLRGLWDNYPRLAAPLTGAPFTKPTLFVRGGRSDYIQPEDEGFIRELFPAARIETIPDASHWIHADKPEEFLKLVLGFL